MGLHCSTCDPCSQKGISLVEGKRLTFGVCQLCVSTWAGTTLHSGLAAGLPACTRASGGNSRGRTSIRTPGLCERPWLHGLRLFIWLATHTPLERGSSKRYQKQKEKAWDVWDLGGSLDQNCLWDVGTSKTGWSLTTKACEDSRMLCGDCCLLLVSQAKHSRENEHSTSQSCFERPDSLRLPCP